MLKPEQILQLQLEVSETLTRHTTRDGIGLALAEVINRVVPFQFFLHSIWIPGSQTGYRISSIKNPEGKFEVFKDTELEKIKRDSLEAFIQTGLFLNKPGSAGIYLGNDLKALAERFPTFALGYHHHGIRSVMILQMKHENGYTNVFVISEKVENAFTPSHFQMISTLLPQIQLAYDNLFKYEELRRQEEERKLQLTIATAFTGFDGKRSLDEMAIDAFVGLNDFISFDFWFVVTKIAPRKENYFRLTHKRDGKFTIVDSDEVFKRINHPPIDPAAFKEQHSYLFDQPKLYVGELMDSLIEMSTYFKACHDTLNLNSLVAIPLSILGSKETVYLLGSTRHYAFTENDMSALVRVMPYISMAGQQFYFLLKIQALTRQLEMEKNYLVEEIKSTYNYDEMVGSSPLMREVFNQISQVVTTDSTVLILGETGTGKELIARALHNQSPRKEKVLVKVNCASLPAQLIESELFGHEKGSFTGALEKRIGKFELANGGTIFLDEIGELPIELQAKLLRVLQEREIERIGGKAVIPLDVRIIAATNRDLETEVVEGRFRSDLFYRLSVFPISVPPLRERKEDIPLLITHFLQRFTKKFKKPFKNLNSDSLRELVNYEWPGNIRELENVIEQAVIVGDWSSIKLRRPSAKKITAMQVKENEKSTPSVEFGSDEIIRTLKLTKGKINGPEGAAAILNLRPSQIEEHERKWILDALRKTSGRIRGDNGAAELIGVKPTTLEARVRKLKIEKGEIFR
jgi:formate hydrogenlyase transcriptional activator